MKKVVILFIACILVVLILSGCQYLSNDKISINEFLFRRSVPDFPADIKYSNLDKIYVILKSDAEEIDVNYFGENYVSEIEYISKKYYDGEVMLEVDLVLYKYGILNQIYCAMHIAQIPEVVEVGPYIPYREIDRVATDLYRSSTTYKRSQ